MNDQPILGDTLVLDVYCPAELLPITGASFNWMLKRRRSDPEASALSVKDSPTGILIRDTTTGWIQVKVPSTETANFPPGVALPHNLQIKTASGDIYTIARGTITFEAGTSDRT